MLVEELANPWRKRRKVHSKGTGDIDEIRVMNVVHKGITAPCDSERLFSIFPHISVRRGSRDASMIILDDLVVRVTGGVSSGGAYGAANDAIAITGHKPEWPSLNGMGKDLLKVTAADPRSFEKVHRAVYNWLINQRSVGCK